MAGRLPTPDVLLTFPTPNYVNPVTHGNSLTVVNAVFLGIATISLVARLVIRGFIKNWLGWDDFFICLAFLPTIGVHVVLNLGVQSLGWDRHIWDVQLNWVEGSLKNVYAGELLFLIASEFTILSFLSFYYRLNSDASIPWFNWTLHAAVFINVSSWLAFFLMAVFQCQPISIFWTWPAPPNAKCINARIILFGGCIVKLFIDILVTTLPIPLVLRLRLSRSRKWAVLTLLGLGYFITAVTATRTYFTYYILWRSYDETWYNYYGFLAATVENDLGIFCACAPALRPVLNIIVSRFNSSFRSSEMTSTSKTPAGMTISRSGDDESKGKMSMTMPREPAPIATDNNTGRMTFWRSTIHSDSSENNEGEEFRLPRMGWDEDQITSARDIHTDIERGFDYIQDDQIREPKPVSRQSKESTFRTWRIDNNPFREGNNPYQQNQQDWDRNND